MSLRLKKKESASAGIRRIAREELDVAIELLADRKAEPSEVVHELRKKFKKIRAVVRLVRDDLGEEVPARWAEREAEPLLAADVGGFERQPISAGQGFEAVRFPGPGLPSGTLRLRMTRMRSQIAAALAGLLAAAASWMILRRYRRDVARARDRVSTGRIVETALGPIEYSSAGDGPPVLVVHGAGGGFDQGIDFGRELTRRGFGVIAMSRFGYLGTPLPDDASPAAQADAHAALLDAVGVRRAAVVGASAGAPSSVQFALRHPDRIERLVLVVPALYVSRPGSEPSVRTPAGTSVLFDTALASDFLFWAATRLARRMMIRAILATPPEIEAAAEASERTRVAETLDHILPVTARRLGLRNDAAVTSSLPRYELEKISAPTLVISVADDGFGTWDAARYTADHVPGARFMGFATGGHVWVGHQDEIAAEIASFLK